MLIMFYLFVKIIIVNIFLRTTSFMQKLGTQKLQRYNKQIIAED
jgi:hypothetical protein